MGLFCALVSGSGLRLTLRLQRFERAAHDSLGMLYTSVWSGTPPPKILRPAGLYPLYSPLSRSGVYLAFSSSGSS